MRTLHFFVVCLFLSRSSQLTCPTTLSGRHHYRYHFPPPECLASLRCCYSCSPSLSPGPGLSLSLSLITSPTGNELKIALIYRRSCCLDKTRTTSRHDMQWRDADVRCFQTRIIIKLPVILIFEITHGPFLPLNKILSYNCLFRLLSLVLSSFVYLHYCNHNKTIFIILTLNVCRRWWPHLR